MHCILPFLHLHPLTSHLHHHGLTKFFWWPFHSMVVPFCGFWFPWFQLVVSILCCVLYFSSACLPVNLRFLMDAPPCLSMLRWIHGAFQNDGRGDHGSVPPPCLGLVTNRWFGTPAILPPLVETLTSSYLMVRYPRHATVAHPSGTPSNLTVVIFACLTT